MNSNSQARKYQLTINNPQEYGMDRARIIEELNKLTLTYFCVVDEISSTNTFHTHIFLYSTSPIRFSTIKKRFPIAHIERAVDSVKNNRCYLLKEGKWATTEKSKTTVKGSFYEWGDIPSEQDEKAPEMARLIEMVNEGMTTAEIIKSHPKYAFKANDINNLRETLLSDKYMHENRDVEVTYVWGETGTGKTSSIYEKYSAADICRITTYTSNGARFDAYRGQDVLVLEEYHSQIPLPELLSYIDRYPIMLPARYYDRVACFSKVYILSNIPLNRQYVREHADDPATWNAFRRRIGKVFRQISMNLLIDETEENYEKH